MRIVLLFALGWLTLPASARADEVVLFAESTLSAESIDALSLELSAAGHTLSTRASSGDDARTAACRGTIVLVLDPPSPPTAPPVAHRIACDLASDREVRLSLPLDTIAPRAFAITLADLASASEPAAEPATAASAEVAVDTPVVDTAAVDTPVEIPPVEIAPPREVHVARAPDWTGRPFLRLGGQGGLELEIGSSATVANFMAGTGAGVVGFGVAIAPWFRPVATARFGASGFRSFEALLNLAPEFVIALDEGAVVLAPALVLGWLDGAAIGGALDVGYEFALGAQSPVRGWTSLRFSALAIDGDLPLVTIGLSVGVDIAP